MDPTTLVTFFLECSSSVRTVELLGSWDNFGAAYDMKRDSRKGKGHWSGCYRFKDIICDGDLHNLSSRREGGLMMGGLYWYYYRLDGVLEHFDSTMPSTTSCPLMPGQRVNVLEVPEENISPYTPSTTPLPAPTLDPADKFQTPRPTRKVYRRLSMHLDGNTDLLPRSWSPDHAVRRPVTFDVYFQETQVEIGLGRHVQSSPSHLPSAVEPVLDSSKPDNKLSDLGGSRLHSHHIRHDSFANPFEAQPPTNTCSYSASATSPSRGTSLISSRPSSLPDYLSQGSRSSLREFGRDRESVEYSISSLESYYDLVRKEEEPLGSIAGRSIRRRRSSSDLPNQGPFLDGAFNPVSPLRPMVDTKIINSITEDMKEVRIGDWAPSLLLKEFGPSGSMYDIAAPRPRSRHNLLDSVPAFASIMDQEVPILPTLLEESESILAEDDLDFGAPGEKSNKSVTSDLQEDLSLWDPESRAWHSPLSEGSLLQSPTFSSNSECSSSLHTPDRHPNASIDDYFQDDDGRRSIDEGEGDYNLGPLSTMGDRTHVSSLTIRTRPDSEPKQDRLRFNGSFNGYSLPDYLVASDATLTQPALPTDGRATTPRTAGDAAGQHTTPVNPTQQLMDEFAYLREAVL